MSHHLDRWYLTVVQLSLQRFIRCNGSKEIYEEVGNGLGYGRERIFDMNQESKIAKNETHMITADAMYALSASSESPWR